MFRRFDAKVVVLLLAAGAAPAQAQEMDEVVAAAKNQLGLLEYCQAEGHIEARAVEVQQQMFARLPAPGNPAKAEAAYQKGRSGTVSAMGVEQSLRDASASQNSEVAALCRQMAALVTQSG